ncbi:transcription factor IBH1 [Amborella trichopoda]|nr:transcription factor IBH1 [Amborella trichopoda]|eukprot:XP_006845486.2 transcription factor IBH1 [Amborella trichopoda]
MQETPKSFRHEFLRQLLLGLKHSSSRAQEMSLLERKKAIKLAADTALAMASDGSHWSRALISNLSKLDGSQSLIKTMMGDEAFQKIKKPINGASAFCRKLGARRVLKGYTMRMREKKRVPPCVSAQALAKKLVKRRTEKLKCLIPGGEFMDRYSLLVEASDYILSLKAQVDVMQRLANVLACKDIQLNECV